MIQQLLSFETASAQDVMVNSRYYPIIKFGINVISKKSLHTIQ